MLLNYQLSAVTNVNKYRMENTGDSHSTHYTKTALDPYPSNLALTDKRESSKRATYHTNPQRTSITDAPHRQHHANNTPDTHPHSDPNTSSAQNVSPPSQTDPRFSTHHNTQPDSKSPHQEPGTFAAGNRISQRYPSWPSGTVCRLHLARRSISPSPFSAVLFPSFFSLLGFSC